MIYPDLRPHPAQILRSLVVAHPHEHIHPHRSPRRQWKPALNSLNRIGRPRIRASRQVQAPALCGPQLLLIDVPRERLTHL